MVNCRIESIEFPSTGGRETVRGKIYIPEGEIKGIVQISHGMCEFIGRYDDLMRYMASEGFIAAGNDHIGHGSSSAPEDYGYFAERDGWRIPADDLHVLTKELKDRYGDLPFFLLGHSMGSFIARLYAARYGDELDGAIICGTAGPDPMAAVGAKISGIVAALCGSRHRSPMIDRMAFGSYNRRCTPKRTGKDWLTKDEAIVDRYIAEPRCMFTFTASGFRDLMTMLSVVNRDSWFSSIRKDLPVYLIAGEEDPVGKYGKGVMKIFDRLREKGLEDVSVKLYRDDRHEIFNETDRRQVYEDTMEWITDHI